MRCLILLFFVIGCIRAHSELPSESEDRSLYEQFKRDYNKKTRNDDDVMRFQIFRHNIQRINEFKEADEGTAEYGITEFSDMTAEEFESLYANARIPNTNEEEPSPITAADLPEPPVSIDWHAKGAVGPAVAQLTCGSCWAFSTVANIEGQWFMKTGQLFTLSKQQLVDCDKGNHGCRSGHPMMAYHQIKRMGGLVKETDYPYEALDKECRLNRSQIVAHIHGSVRLDRDEKLHAAYLAEHGPLSSMLNAGGLQFYNSGILKLPTEKCSKTFVNHAVLTVGYGVEGDVPYWLIRNSWGSTWGKEKGFFRIYRGDNTCSIDRAVTSSIIK